MLRNAFAPLILSALLSVPAAAQSGAAQKVLDHDAYDIWNRITTQEISDDGRYVLYVLSSEANDPRLIVKDAATGATLHEVARGDEARFTEDARFVVFKLEPAKEAVEAAKKAKKKQDEMPRDSLGILDLSTGGIVRIANVASFALPEDAAGWLAYHHAKEPTPDSARADTAGAPGAMPEPPATPAGEPARGQQAENGKKREDGTTLVVRNLATEDERRIELVNAYAFSKDGAHLAYTAVSRDGSADGAFVLATASGTVTPLLTGKGDYESLTFDESGRKLGFLSNRDDFEAEQPGFALYAWDGGDAARLIADGASTAIPEGWWISEHGTLSFSKNGERLFFGTAPRPEPETPDSLKPAEDERVVVDVWAWTDPYLQPMQLRQLDEERRRTYTAVAHVRDRTVVQLGALDVPDVLLAADGNAARLIGRSNLPYRQQVSWGESGTDYYVIDPRTGERELVLEYVRGNASVSPGGKYLAWFDGDVRHWFVLDIASGATVNVSESMPHPLENELHDAPSLPGPYGSAGWTEGDELFLVYDRHDVWAVDPRGRAEPRNITEGVGRRDNLRFRYVDLERTGGGGGFGFGGPAAARDPIDPDEPILLSAFDYRTKADGFYRDRVTGSAEPARLMMADKSLGSPRKAEDADVLLLTRASFREFPDLYVAEPDFRELRRMSDANPQQAEYRWGTSELVEWRSATGEPLQGVLYKPDGFDPSREYPMMVYFYERLSDRLHNYVIPAAGSSSINISFYVSRGYLVFTPDIPYRIGYPGESAMNAVVPGVLSLLERGFVDRDRIGLQGHSWGGYQIAYMITETDLFAAAEAGAPVANMISAYGGIRWGTGMSRMFQYEKTQSRIGGTLWEQPLRFIENSPIFYAHKVSTPLLMMHNDEDGAVPWEQGIEYFVALRRLQKPVWMLNYNGEDHGLRKEHNQKDWAVRMQQFFDHYLMDAPAPVWMAEGVPAILKGRTLGLEYVDEKPAATKPVTESGSRE